MDIFSLFVLFTYFWIDVAADYRKGYSEKNYEISLETISYDDYGAECSVTYTSAEINMAHSMWFVDGVPVLFHHDDAREGTLTELLLNDDDADWLVEEKSSSPFTSTLKSRRKLKYNEVDNKAIYVNFYSSNCKTTVDFGSIREDRRVEYKVSSNSEFLYLSQRTNYLTGTQEFSTNTAIGIKSTRTPKLETKLQWEIVRLSNGYQKYTQNLPIHEGSSTKWKYSGPSNSLVFARLQFSAVVKGDFYNPFIAIKYVRDVKLFSNGNSYFSRRIPTTYVPDDTVFKDVNKDTRLYKCVILEVVPVSKRSYMYLKSNSKAASTTDLRFFPYAYVHYGYQTELYSIVRDPAHVSDKAYCKAAMVDPPGHSLTKAV